MRFFNLIATAVCTPYMQRLAYLESATNGCYIDSGIVPTSNTIVKFKYDFIGFGDNSGAMIFGQTATYGTRANMFGCGPSQTTERLYRFYAATGAYLSAPYTNEDLVFERGGLSYADGTVIASPITVGTMTTNRTLYLFAENYGGTVYRAGRIKIFYLQIYEGATMVRDFIPVLDWNEVPCMYDRVSGQFFYNQGTGQFLPGFIPGQEIPFDSAYGVWLKQSSTVISSGMTMTDAVVSAGQTQYIYSCGNANNCTVRAQGFQNISSGGVANGCDVAHYQYVLAGGTAQNTIAHYRHFVSSGGSAIGTVLRVAPELAASIYPAADVTPGAFASGFVVESRGTAWVRTSSAFDFTAVSGGYIQIYASAVLSGAVLSAAGRLLVQGYGTAIEVTTMSGAIITVSSHGLANGGSMLSSGSGRVEPGGVISGMTVYAGGRVDALSAGTVAAPLVSGGLVYMYTGGFVSGGTVFNGGRINGGGNPVSVTVSSGGSLTLLANATGSDIILAAGGSLMVVGIAFSTIVSNGTGFVYSGGYASGVVVGGTAANAGRWYVQSTSATLTKDLIISAGGYVVVQKGGAVVSGVQISSGGFLYALSTGSAVDLIVSSGGTAAVGTGTGVLSNVTILKGGRLNGSGNNNRIENVDISSGGVAWQGFYNSVTVHPGGSIFAQQSTTNIVLNSAAFAQIAGYISNCSLLAGPVNVGGTLYDFTQNGGSTTLSTGATCSNATVYNGTFRVLPTATATSVVLSSGGTLVVSSAGTALAVTSNAGAVVTVIEGGYIEYVTP